MQIFHLVCANGLGHFKRTTDIWKRLGPNTQSKVVIGCAAWQLERTSSWPAVQQINQMDHISFLPINMEGSIVWKEDYSNYTRKDYSAFVTRISQLPEFKAADLVISDNHASFLEQYPNQILFGSFLWPDVLSSADKGFPMDILEQERKLLKQNHPKMVSIGEATMPSVQTATQNHKVNWLCDTVYDRPEEEKQVTNILFSAGLSGASKNRLLDLLKSSLSQNDIKVFLTPALVKNIKLERGYEVFDFEPSSFQKIDLMVVRPGIGSITEAIQYQIPLACMDDGENSEMLFNAKRVEELGIGLNLINQGLSLNKLIDNYPYYLKNIKERPVNGFDQIQNILKDYL